MEQQIRYRYSDIILQEAMRRYDIATDKIWPLDAFESFIYEFERGPRPIFCASDTVFAGEKL